MRNGKRTLWVGLLFAAGPALAVVFEGGPDPVIYPRQRIPIQFSHRYHVTTPDEKKGVAGEGLECDFCHENVAASVNSSDRDIPGHETCESCHAEWIGEADKPAPKAECARCHRDLAEGAETAAPIDLPPPNLKFPHQNHVDAGVACTACHAQVPDKTLATRDDYPTMDRCVACHQERGVSTECKTCHLTLPSGRLATEFSSGRLKPARLHSAAIHDADFLRDHALPAQRDKAYCAQCHSQNDCLECHDGFGRDTRYHPGDWIAVHGIRSKLDDFRCQSCHTLQKFCLDCHVRSGVATVSDLGTLAPTRRTVRLAPDGQKAIGPHPMGPEWIDPTSRNFHGFHAQRNIRSCASCHQEQFCLTCHQSSFGTSAPASIGGNPHGPNPERLRGSTARKQNARMCLKCHHPADPSWR